MPACGGDDGPGGGEPPVCPDGMPLALHARTAPNGTPTTLVAVVSDDEIVAEVPRGERGVTFDSFLWAPDGSAIALLHLFGAPESGLLDPSCQPFDALPAPGTVVAWSPGGNQLLLSRAVEVDGRRRAEYGIAPVSAGQVGTPEVLASFDAGPAGGEGGVAIHAVWSADSSAVAFAVFTEEEAADGLPGHLYLVDTGAIAPEAVEVGAIAGMHGFAWSPRGASIAFIDGDPGVNLIEMVGDEAHRVDGSREVCTFDDAPDQVQLFWSPDGRAFLYAARYPNEDCELRQVSLDGGDAVVETRTLPDSGSALRPAWFRDSRHVVHPSGDGASLLWTDPETFASTPIVPAAVDARISRFAFTRYHRRLAIVREMGEEAEVLVAETPGAQPGPATAAATVGVHVAAEIHWAPNEEELAVTGLPGAYIALPDQAEEMTAMDAGWSPDSRYLVLEQDRKAIVYRPEAGALGDGRLVAEELWNFAWAPLAP